ncbi:MAG: thioredoxin domain-containing protein [bacterium]|nr:thioredoxin domain-containing protein [bacterium]
MLRIPKVKFNLAGKVVPFLVAVIVVMAFGMGLMWGKLQGSNKIAGTTAPRAGQGAASKYASFDEAMTALAKQVGLDSQKLVTCMNSGEKKTVVEADAAEGSAMGVAGTPAFYVNGRFLGGAFPLGNFKEIIDRELAGKGSSKVADYSDSLQQAAKNGYFDPIPKKISLGNAPINGDPGAAVTLIEYSDFQCPYCAQAFPTIKQILDEYGDKVVFAYKHFPLSQIHPHAQKTAEAAECARDQGKFWEFHDALFASQDDWAAL